VAYCRVLSLNGCGRYEKNDGDSNLTSIEWKSERTSFIVAKTQQAVGKLVPPSSW